jgi:uncharacterized protein YndB with AHSA1/START domain
MESNHTNSFSIDKATNTILVEKTFLAPLESVWDAWTKRDSLDQWWAPKPWKAITKTMDFREGGHWLYCMEGPEGERSWGKAIFKSIKKYNNFEVVDTFTDESGKENYELPTLHWKISFKESYSKTIVTIKIKCDSYSDIEKIMEMGFKEGFESALGNLEEFLEQ